MGEEVVIKTQAVITALGSLPQTVERLYAGSSGILPGPIFGIPVAFAPFPDVACRRPAVAAGVLAEMLSREQIDYSRCVFISCSVKGDLSGLESASNDPPPCLEQQAHQIADGTGKRFASIITISGACASGTLAVETARELLLDHEYDHAVIFGLDTLSRFVVSGFHSLGALSTVGARPFDRDRDGLTPGEAVACALLTRKKPAPADIVIAGAGSANDANHRTGPSRTGDGLCRAATAALKDAGIGPEDVAGVKCHGTGTVYNDAMEAKALSRLLGQSIPPCFSLKGALGHASGAGALAETLLAAQFLQQGVVPPTAGLQTRGVEEPIPVSSRTAPLRNPTMMCLSAGFGGINAAVLLRKPTS